jgi:F-type H+-transporting ATPase subunit a
MGHHAFTWLSAIPGVNGIPENAATAILVTLLLLLFAFRLRPKLADTERAIQPEDGVTGRNFAEVFVEGISGLAEGVIGHHYKQYVPLLATFFIFILVSNLLGLVPGFIPPTSSFSTTLALGVISFIAYNVYGVKAHGPGYFKHFLGPVMFIAPLMLFIELFSHAFRPISLGIRLFANLFADHEVVTIFTDLTKVGVPVMFYVLGAFVSVVQAFVFTMLSAIYIALSVSHDH